MESVQHLPPFLNWSHTYTGMGRCEIGRLAWNLRGVVAFYRTSLEPMKLVISNRLISTISKYFGLQKRKLSKTRVKTETYKI